MIDFFDEDFPLTKKQEEAMLRAEKAKSEELNNSAVQVTEAEEQPDNVSEQTSSSEVLSDNSEPADNEDESVYPSQSEEQAVAVDAQAAADEAEVSQPADEEGEVSEAVIEQDQAADDFSLSSEGGDISEAVEESEDESGHNIDNNEVVISFGTQNAVQCDCAMSPDALSQNQASIDDVDAALHAELKSLVEKLDDMERFVDTMDFGREEPADSDDSDFNYEYDDRYFAEEETPAYKYPELYKKSEQPKPVRKKEQRSQSKSDNINLNINKKTLFKVGAIVAAAAAAVTLLGDKDDR